MDGLNRRDFAGLLMGAAAVMAANAEGQAPSSGAAAADKAAGVTEQAAGAPAQTASGARGMKTLTSGVFKPQAGKGMVGGHESHQFLSGMLAAGNIRLEMHESVQAPGAPHEAVGTHKHSEIWLVQRGTATLYLNGVEHTMDAGDVGVCCAGDEHWVANKGSDELAYFVVTVGPPE
jgi:quercetin dioxygenase-like cupin family protein